MWVIRFQSTPPVWAETAPLSYKSYQAKISIHSARVGGDAYWQCFHNKNWTYFNPLRPCGRRPSLMLSTSTPFSHFNPLRPCGRRLISANFGDASDEFQSTPPVWAETQQANHSRRISTISIHSARVGGDEYDGLDTLKYVEFQSTPPVWAETNCAPSACLPMPDFNPLRPCGRRPYQCRENCP